MAYASNNKYGGQKATQGRVVIMRDADHYPEPAVIHTVRIENENSDGRPEEVVIVDYLGGQHNDLAFVETSAPEDVDSMPAKTWTWPPRV